MNKIKLFLTRTKILIILSFIVVVIGLSSYPYLKSELPFLSENDTQKRHNELPFRQNHKLKNALIPLPEKQNLTVPTTMNLIGGVTLASRGFLFERYGTKVFELSNEKIESSGLALTSYDQNFMIGWSGAKWPKGYLDKIHLSYDNSLNLTAIYFRKKNGRSWVIKTSDEKQIEKIFSKSVDPVLVESLEHAKPLEHRPSYENGLLKSHLADSFDATDLDAIYLSFSQPIPINEFSISNFKLFWNENKSLADYCLDNARTLTGTVFENHHAERVPRAWEVKLKTSEGENFYTLTDKNGRYEFTNVNCDKAISVSSKAYVNGEQFFGHMGRWSIANEVVDLNIFLDNSSAVFKQGKRYPVIVPPKNEWHFKRAKFPRPDFRLGRGQPHSKFYHIGKPGTQQIWEQFSFLNYRGFWDLDRREQTDLKYNKNCLRILIIGNSHTTSIQMNNSQKFNVLAEEEFKRLTGKCVFFMTAGMGGGNPADFYLNSKEYAELVKPDLILMEATADQIIKGFRPLMRQIIGDNDNFPKEAYFFNTENKELNLIKPSKLWAKQLDQDKKLFPKFKCSDLDEAAKYHAALNKPDIEEAWQHYFAVTKHIEKKFNIPIMIFSISTTLNTSQNYLNAEQLCHEGEASTVFGEKIFELLLNKQCKKHEIDCFFFPTPNSSPKNSDLWLTWANDGHMNWLGHQYIGEHLGQYFARHFFPEIVNNQMANNFRGGVAIGKTVIDLMGLGGKGTSRIRYDNLSFLYSLSTEERRKFLNIIDNGALKRIEQFILLMTRKGYKFCNLENRAKCLENNKNIVVRYDVHPVDIIPALFLIEIHKKYDIPATFYITYDQTNKHIFYNKFMEMLLAEKSPLIGIAPHPSHISDFVLRQFKQQNVTLETYYKNFCENWNFEKLGNFSERKAKDSYEFFKLRFGIHTFKTASMHGSLFWQHAKNLFPDISECKHLDNYRYLFKMEGKKAYENLGIFETTLPTYMKSSYEFVSEKTTKDLWTLINKGNPLLFLVHPAVLAQSKSDSINHLIIKDTNPNKQSDSGINRYQ